MSTFQSSAVSPSKPSFMASQYWASVGPERERNRRCELESPHIESWLKTHLYKSPNPTHRPCPRLAPLPGKRKSTVKHPPLRRRSILSACLLKQPVLGPVVFVVNMQRHVAVPLFRSPLGETASSPLSTHQNDPHTLILPRSQCIIVAVVVLAGGHSFVCQGFRITLRCSSGHQIFHGCGGVDALACLLCQPPQCPTERRRLSLLCLGHLGLACGGSSSGSRWQPPILCRLVLQRRTACKEKQGEDGQNSLEGEPIGVAYHTTAASRWGNRVEAGWPKVR